MSNDIGDPPAQAGRRATFVNPVTPVTSRVVEQVVQLAGAQGRALGDREDDKHLLADISLTREQVLREANGLSSIG